MKVLKEIETENIVATLFSDGKIHLVDNDEWTDTNPLVVTKDDLEKALNMFNQVRYGMTSTGVQPIYLH